MTDNELGVAREKGSEYEVWHVRGVRARGAVPDLRIYRDPAALIKMGLLKPDAVLHRLRPQLPTN